MLNSQPSLMGGKGSRSTAALPCRRSLNRKEQTQHAKFEASTQLQSHNSNSYYRVRRVFALLSYLIPTLRSTKYQQSMDSESELTESRATESP
jgi:hypothetical protein